MATKQQLDLRNEITFVDYWNTRNVKEIFLAGVGCPGGTTLTDTTDDEDVADEDYCELDDCLRNGLIKTKYDHESAQYTEGYLNLKGTIDQDDSWVWNGQDGAWDLRGNDYYKIVLISDDEEYEVKTDSESETIVAKSRDAAAAKYAEGAGFKSRDEDSLRSEVESLGGWLKIIE